MPPPRPWPAALLLLLLAAAPLHAGASRVLDPPTAPASRPLAHMRPASTTTRGSLQPRGPRLFGAAARPPKAPTSAFQGSPMPTHASLWAPLVAAAMGFLAGRRRRWAEPPKALQWASAAMGAEAPAAPSSVTAGPSLSITDPSDRLALAFLRDGHVRVSGLLPSAFVADTLAPAIRQWHADNRLSALRHAAQVSLGVPDAGSLTPDALKTVVADASAEDPGCIPFLQSFNLWRSCPAARSVALSPSLGQLAAGLLGVPAVRLYQDALFIKRPNDGATEWHSDLNMAPFDTNSFVTCWIPLQPVPATADGGTALLFADGSHRDFALPYWSDPCGEDLSPRYSVAESEAFEPGDCTFHHGWVLHGAPSNDSDETRFAYSVSFVADGAALLREERHRRRPDTEDAPSYGDWIGTVGWGGVARHPDLPLVYAAQGWGRVVAPGPI